MSSPIIILKSYIKNGGYIRGNFPIYIKGVSQCCIDAKGQQKITPVIVPIPANQK